MGKFEVGDVVTVLGTNRELRLDHAYCGCLTKGDTKKIKQVFEFSRCPSYKLEGDKDIETIWIKESYLELSKRHQHYDCIVAWAKGEEIEYCNGGGEWWTVRNNPKWYEDTQYRIKPKKTAQEVEIEAIEEEMRKLADRLKGLKEGS